MDQLQDPQFKKLTDKFFWESFYGIFIFGIPAFAGLFLGQVLDAHLSTGRLWTLVFLAVAFISSWVLIWFRNKRVTRMYRDFREEQKKAHQQPVSQEIETQ